MESGGCLRSDPPKDGVGEVSLRLIVASLIRGAAPQNPRSPVRRHEGIFTQLKRKGSVNFSEATKFTVRAATSKQKEPIQAPLDTWSGRERAPSTAQRPAHRRKIPLLALRAWMGAVPRPLPCKPDARARESATKRREAGRIPLLALRAWMGTGLDGAKHHASSHQAFRPRPTGRGPREQQVHTQAKKEADQNQRGPEVSAR